MPYPANTLASSALGNIKNHSSRKLDPKNRPKLSINPKMMLEKKPTMIVTMVIFSPLNHTSNVASGPTLYRFVNHAMIPNPTISTKVIKPNWYALANFMSEKYMSVTTAITLDNTIVIIKTVIPMINVNCATESSYVDITLQLF